MQMYFSKINDENEAYRDQNLHLTHSEQTMPLQGTKIRRKNEVGALKLAKMNRP